MWQFQFLFVALKKLEIFNLKKLHKKLDCTVWGGENCENPEVLLGHQLNGTCSLFYNKKYNVNVSMLVHTTNLANARMT